MANNSKDSMNIWKILFFSLLAVILIPIIGLFLSRPKVEEINTRDFIVANDDLSISIEVGVEDVESIVNIILAQEAQNSDIQYALSLDEQARLLGQTAYLGIPFSFSVNMIPETLENGNVLLAIDEITLSGYELPQQLVLNILARQLELPDFVVFNPDDGYIGINFNQFQLDNGGRIQVDQFDLGEDTVQVTIHLPQSVFNQN